MSRGENELSARRARRRLAGEPGPPLPSEARERLLGEGGARIETDPSPTPARTIPQAGGLPRAKPDQDKPWAYGAGRCLHCGGKPFQEGDVMRCDTCGWAWSFNRGTGRWEPAAGS